ARRVAGGKSPDDVYTAALDAILSGLRCDRASILLYDQDEVMRFVAWRGLSQKYRRAVEGHSPWKPHTRDPKPVCVSDVNTAKLTKSLKATIRAEGIGAAAFIPLVTDQTLIGKFMAYYDSPHASSDSELKVA